MNPSLEPGTRIEKYVIERLLGAGGMGSVWLARHEGLGSPHALKLLHDSSPDIDARLRQEGQLQARLSHPNIVRVTDTVEVRGRPGLVLEYVDGRTLADLLVDLAAQQRALSIPEIDELARGILRGVGAAHDQGWIHRDLKPGNVLVQENDGGLVPKVTDFGLAKVLDGEAQDDMGSTSRRGLGTRRYMPLEQLIGLKPDQRLDVFALGAVLYELAMGRPAFATVEDWESCMRNKVYPLPTRPDLPVRMQQAIAASLCEREARVGNARELHQLWSDGTSLAPTFHPETLHAARRAPTPLDEKVDPRPAPEETWLGPQGTPVLGEHLGEDRLLAKILSPEEHAHLERCGRCRSEVRRAKNFMEEVGSTALPSGSLPPETASGPVRWSERRGLLLAGMAALAGLALAALVALWPSPPAPIAQPAPTAPPVPIPQPLRAQPVPPEIEPLPAPSPPVPSPSRKRPAGQGTLVVNTMNGPVGRFRIDTGALTTVGPLRRQTVGAGEHRVMVLASDGTTEWEGVVTVGVGEDVVVCWDLQAHARCR